jgi:hypothetical protein
MGYEETVTAEEKRKDDQLNRNAESLEREITWFAQVVNAKLHKHFPEQDTALPEASGEKGKGLFNLILGWQQGKAKDGEADGKPRESEEPATNILPPDLSGDQSVYADFVNYYKLTTDARLLLMLALIPHVQPHLLDVFFSINKTLGRGYTEFGGVKGTRHSGFIPTVETALFLLAGNDLDHRFRLYKFFEPDHLLQAHGIIIVDQGNVGNEPFHSSSIIISEEYVDFFTTGILRKPQFSMDFPAKRLCTQMDWADLVVDDFTAGQLDEIRIWLQHGKKLYYDWGMSKKLKPGYKALFYGPPGTGKTLTASLLGKLYNLDVYRVDLSMVISKYIGETEKNLEKVFKKAENKNWILFFDEADALFGKRTGISDSHDKYANQEIAYLMVRLEDYPGLVILASNMRNNMDDAFTRRLQSIIHFQKPQPRERFRIWSNAFSPECQLPKKEELERIAKQYELSGGSIMNVVQYASLMALNRGDINITIDDLVEGIKKEYRKEGKTL